MMVALFQRRFRQSLHAVKMVSSNNTQWQLSRRAAQESALNPAVPISRGVNDSRMVSEPKAIE
jgi:hypothetical protein